MWLCGSRCVGHEDAGAVTSPFEQLVRATFGLPLGSSERHSDAVMKNLIGSAVEKWRETLSEPNAKPHLYGKERALPGRKRATSRGSRRGAESAGD